MVADTTNKLCKMHRFYRKEVVLRHKYVVRKTIKEERIARH